MKDRADYARKGIARGRSLIAVECDDGILICAENHRTLRKVSEIYDRIAFAGVGKYNEFDQLRIAGVRHADLKGYSYSREDVDARSLANQYAQILGQTFTHEMKPLEVEILVAEIGHPRRTACSTSSTTAPSSTSPISRCSAATPRPSTTASRVSYRPDLDRAGALVAAPPPLAGEGRTLTADELEVAELARHNGRAVVPPPRSRATSSPVC
jgi:proteasome alpha subunit